MGRVNGMMASKTLVDSWTYQSIFENGVSNHSNFLRVGKVTCPNGCIFNEGQHKLAEVMQEMLSVPKLSGCF